MSDGKHPCPKGDDCALNNGAILCFACGRTWPPSRPIGWRGRPTSFEQNRR